MSLKIHYGIYQSKQAYCYLSQTGSVYSWGSDSYGGNSLHLAKDISENIVKIIASERGFCALRNDGKVFSWGYGNEYLNYNIDEENSDYIDIFHGWTTYFTGLKKNGRIYVWGDKIFDTWNSQWFSERNKTIKAQYYSNGIVGLRQDGTLNYVGKLGQYSGHETIQSQKTNLKNIKEIYSNSLGILCLKNDNTVFLAGGYGLTHSTHGIRGRDGKLGDVSVLNTGIQGIYPTENKFYILKDDGSLHVIGQMYYTSGGNDYYDDDITVKQYKKVSSGVKFVFVDRASNYCICIKDDDTALALYTDDNKINNKLVNIAKIIDRFWVIDNNGKAICLQPDTFTGENKNYTTNFSAIESQLTSGVVDIKHSYNAAGESYIGCTALKSDGSLVSFGNTSHEWWNHTTKLKNHDNQLDSTLGDGGVVALYCQNRNFTILRDDGKVYAWGDYSHATSLTTLTDVSNSTFVGTMNGFKENYSYSYLDRFQWLALKPNEYEDDSSTTLNQSKYNSSAYSVANTFNTFTTFTPDLNDNGNVYLYNDQTGKGIIENSGQDITFLLNNGLTDSQIQGILNQNLTTSNSYDFPISNYNNTFQRESHEWYYSYKKRRMQMTRIIFQNNYSVKHFFTSKNSLAFDAISTSSSVSKQEFKVMHTLNNTELTYDFANDTYITTTKGFYIFMEENSKTNILAPNSNTFSIECTDFDHSGNQIYYITSSLGDGGLKLKFTNSDSYIRNSYPAGPFKDGDKIIFKDINIILSGGVIENSNSTDEQNYGTTEFVPYIKPIGNKIPIFCGQRGFLGIAKNNYLYSWGDMDSSTQWVSGSKDTNGDWTNSTTDRVTDISNVYTGYQSWYAVLLKNGKIDTRHYGFPDLDDSKNVWYDNGVKKNDLTELNDAVELYCLFNDQAHGSSANAKALVLREDGSIALWSNRDDIKHYNTQDLMSATILEEWTLRGSYGKRLMDSTDPNFSRIIKICRGLSGYVLLREDGKIAVIDRPEGGTNHTHMGDYPSWNRRQGNDYYHNLKPSLDFTLGNNTRNHSTFGSNSVTSQQYFGKVIDIGTFGYTHSTMGMWYVLNERGQFFVFRDYYATTNRAYSMYPPVDICYGDKTLDNPTDSPYFKKTIKVYTTYNNNYVNWLILFEDGTGLTSWSESDYSKSKYTFTDVFTNYSWYHDTNNPEVKGFQSTDSILIDQYYGPYILLKNGYLRNISYCESGGVHYNSNPYYTQTYYNWNHHLYGIKGTGMGYDASEPEYGDISGVKQILFVGHATLCVKTNGELLVWGNNSSNSLKIGNNQITTDITNHFTNVNKVVSNIYSIAILKNDGSVFTWGHSTYGGDITNTIPVGNTGMSNYTLDSGVIDIFCSQYAYTAVKSDGLLVWGHSSYANPGNATNGHPLDALENIKWEAKTDGYNSRTFSNTYAVGGTNASQNISYNEYNYLDYPIYKTNSELNTAINALRDVTASGTDPDFASNLVCFPKNMSSFSRLNMIDTFYKGLSKDDVRTNIINVLLNLCTDFNDLEISPAFLALDSKIITTSLKILKPDTGLIKLSDYNTESMGFYIPMTTGDSVVFQSPDASIVFKLTNSNDRYEFTKISGDDLSSNKVPPFSSKVDINGFTFGFKNGIFSGKDSALQKFNNIIISQHAAAYLTNTGKVITWGLSSYGGFSHDESIFDYTQLTPHTSYDIFEPNENVLSGVIDLISHNYGFIALKDDGTVVTWGAMYATDSYRATHDLQYVPFYKFGKKNTRAIFTNHLRAIATILFDNTVLLWGTGNGHFNYNNNENLTNMKTIIPSYHGFYGIKNNNDFVAWGGNYINIGDNTNGVYSPNWRTVNNFVEHQTKLTNIVECYSTQYANCAINNQGHITCWGYSIQGVMPSSLKNIFNTRTFVNVATTNTCFAAIDTNGGVIAFGENNVYTDTGGQWRDISGEVEANITRIATTNYEFMCLRNDNVAIGIHGNSTDYYGIDFSNNDIRTSSSQQIHLPPSQYITGRYKLKDIKDIFSHRYGFAAITTDNQVICWGHKENYYVTDIDYTKIHGGDLSGNEEDGTRPVALFTNGHCWACLKEDETVVTWEGTSYRTNGSYGTYMGTNYNDNSYGINSDYWGGVNRSTGGAVRNGDGTERTLRNVKNIIPFTYDSNYGGFYAICEDQSGNQYTVGWGRVHDTSRWKYSSPNSSGRAFRHVVDQLNQHSKTQIGIKNSYGLLGDNSHGGWNRSQTENLHEFNFGDRKFTDIPTDFGAPLQTVEIINTEEVIDNILQDISNSSVDICSNFIEEAQKEENKLSEDVDEDEKMSDAVVAEEGKKVAKVLAIDTTLIKNPKELRKQRALRTRLVFSLNPTRNKFVTLSRDLGIVNKFARGRTAIFKVNFGKAEVNLKEDPNVDENTGFYIATQPGDEITMTNRTGNGKFKITQSEEKFDENDEDSSYKYFVELVDGTHPITLFRSQDYIVGSNPMGPFRDGDRARILNTDIEFGSITEGSPNYSFGDPYVNPICGYPTKLPDENAFYRMVEGFGNMFINASVSKLNKSKQQKMAEWFYNKSGYNADKLGFITNGYYYNKFYISSENHVLFCDLDKQCININSNELSYFSIKNNYEYDKQNPICSNEKCNKYTISWNHKNMGNIIFTLRIYENPQIDNGISIDIQNNAQKCIGLLINNYKPHLMKLENIKQNKNKKLRRKLKRTKNKFSIKKLTGKNEYWYNVKK